MPPPIKRFDWRRHFLIKYAYGSQGKNIQSAVLARFDILPHLLYFINAMGRVPASGSYLWHMIRTGSTFCMILYNCQRNSLCKFLQFPIEIRDVSHA
jgi:hypothetical protein